MTKEEYGAECKVCSKPFTLFQWTPGVGMRLKKTEICQTCAKLKNVCQTCILDLEFSLPVQVRDTIAGYKDDLPTSDVNKQYYVNEAEKSFAIGIIPTEAGTGKMTSTAKDQLKKMARSKPYFERNAAHLCTFYIKGACKRGEECPYRHEMPKHKDLEQQNLKDRYYGVNDPVAAKMLNQTDKKSSLKPPEDKTLTSVLLQNVHPEIEEGDIRQAFFSFGDIRSIVMVKKAQLTFVNYLERSAAEKAVAAMYNNCAIKGHVLRVSWGKTKSSEKSDKGEKTSEKEKKPKQIPLPPGAVPVTYSAQDASSLGHVPKK
jgi:pre-mRNA-splicing factor RBM22/SLT11